MKIKTMQMKTIFFPLFVVQLWTFFGFWGLQNTVNCDKAENKVHEKLLKTLTWSSSSQ